jgi:hypothetical protein
LATSPPLDCLPANTGTEHLAHCAPGAAPLRPRAGSARRVPGTPEWPAAAQSRGGHGCPHGAGPAGRLGDSGGDGGSGGAATRFRRVPAAVMDSDSVNLGSNPSPPAKHRRARASGPFRLWVRWAESTGYAALWGRA